jgi:hypothetical protein
VKPMVASLAGDVEVEEAAQNGIPAYAYSTELPVVGEALLFASKAGADPALVRQALMGGFASSRILEVHGERMVKRNFDPGFRIELHQKDLNLALEGARALWGCLYRIRQRRSSSSTPARRMAAKLGIILRW